MLVWNSGVRPRWSASVKTPVQPPRGAGAGDAVPAHLAELPRLGGQLSPLAEVDVVVDAVEVLHHVQRGFGLLLQVTLTQPPGHSVESHLSSFSVLRGFTATIGSSAAVAGTPICRGVDPAGVGTSTSRCKSRSSVV